MLKQRKLVAPGCDPTSLALHYEVTWHFHMFSRQPIATPARAPTHAALHFIAVEGGLRWEHDHCFRRASPALAHLLHVHAALLVDVAKC